LDERTPEEVLPTEKGRKDLIALCDVNQITRVSARFIENFILNNLQNSH
jgi:hypothetical protein